MTETPIMMNQDSLPAAMRAIEQHIRDEYGEPDFSINKTIENVYWDIVGIGNEPRPVEAGEVITKLGEKLEADYTGFNFREFLVAFLERFRSES